MPPRLRRPPELVALKKALLAKVADLGKSTSSGGSSKEVLSRGNVPFLQIEWRRDHLHIEIWLDGEEMDEARASEIARAHPFLGPDAVQVRFERAMDLARVKRWVAASYRYAEQRTMEHEPTEAPGLAPPEPSSRRRGTSTTRAEAVLAAKAKRDEAERERVQSSA